MWRFEKNNLIQKTDILINIFLHIYIYVIYKKYLRLQKLSFRTICFISIIITKFKTIQVYIANYIGFIKAIKKDFII